MADSYAATRELQQARSECDLCSAWTCRAGATAGDLHETWLQEFPSREQSHTLKRRWQVVCGAQDKLIDRYGSIHGPLLNFSVVQALGKTPPFLKHYCNKWLKKKKRCILLRKTVTAMFRWAAGLTDLIHLSWWVMWWIMLSRGNVFDELLLILKSSFKVACFILGVYVIILYLFGD